MGEDKPSWDAIPSLDGLEMDWDYEAENPLGKRAYPRLKLEELSMLIRAEKSDIPVKFVTEKGQFTASLVDLSQGGVCLKTLPASSTSESQLIKIGFFLGERKIISKGRIKFITKHDDYTLLGVEFVGLTGEDDDYIASLYSSVKL